MPDPSYLLAAVTVAAAVTWSLRALPFRVLAPLRASAAVGYLSARMPLGVMVVLLAYSLRDLPLADPARALPGVVALAVTVALHRWRRNAVLSILGGTAVNVVLASLLARPRLTAAPATRPGRQPVQAAATSIRLSSLA